MTPDRGEARTTAYEIVNDTTGHVVEVHGVSLTPNEKSYRESILRAYDDQGHLVQETRREHDGTYEIETKYAWTRDARGYIARVERSEEHVGGAASGQREVQTVTATKRDADGRPLRFDEVTTTLLDEELRAMGKSPPEGTVQRREPMLEREYDPAGRISIEHWRGWEGQPTTRRVTYAEATLKVATDETVMVDNYGRHGRRTVTTYDALGRPVHREVFEASSDGFQSAPQSVSDAGYDQAGFPLWSSSEDGRVTYRYEGDCPADLVGVLAKPDVVWTEP